MEISLGEMLSAALGGCPEDGFAPPTPSPFNPYQLCQANFRQPNRNYNPPGSCAFNVGLQSHNSAPARVALPEKQGTTNIEGQGNVPQAKTKGFKDRFCLDSRTKNSRSTSTPPAKKRVRNKVPNPDEWQVNIRKKACAEGKEYISRRGKRVGPKVVVTLKNCLANCQYRCAKHVSEEKRKEINRAYYSLKNQTQKRDFLIHTTVRCLTKRPKNFNPRKKGRPPKDEAKARERRERKERREAKKKDKLAKQKAKEKAKKEKLKNKGRKKLRSRRKKVVDITDSEEEEDEEEMELDDDDDKVKDKKDKDKKKKGKKDKDKKDKDNKDMGGKEKDDKDNKDKESAAEPATDVSAKNNPPNDSSKSDTPNDSNKTNTPNDLSITNTPNDLSKNSTLNDSNSIYPLMESNKNNPLNVSNMNTSLNGSNQNKAVNESIQNNPYDLHKNHPFSDLPQSNPFDLHRNPFDLHRNPFDLHRNHPFATPATPFIDPNKTIPNNDANKSIPINDANKTITNNEANTSNNNNEANTNNTTSEANTSNPNNEADKSNTNNEANKTPGTESTEPAPVVRVSRRKYTFKYYFYVNEQRVQVCKAFYLGTLNISQSPIYSAHETKNPITNTANEDMRGKNPSCRRKPEGNKEFAREHIRSFPTVKSHCCVASKKMKYLDGHLSVAKMFDLYLQKCIENRIDPVKKSMYHHIFSTEFNLSFLKPPSSKSHKCHS